ncbi:MAG: serine hydrolase domain-containing protein [Betaproteobacteria bacterium]
MSSRVVMIALWLLVLAWASSPGAADDRYANTAAVARKEATAALESAGVFSVTTAVMVDGNIVHAEAYGTIGSGRSSRPDAETQFNAGSISKVFTAVAMLRLRDQGRIDLDKPVVHYLPQFRMNDNRYRRITIRTLLDHTSGMPGTNYYKLFASKENLSYVNETLALLRDTPLKSNPGDINVYCNDCFTVAQAVIERVSGMTFADFVRREIFTKARMGDSSYSFREGNRNIAAAYAPDFPDLMLPPEIVNARGTGGLTTTAVDLCLFSRAFLDGELLSASSMKELQNRQPGRLGSGFSLTEAGLGWDSVAEPEFAARGLTVLGKDGFTVFFKSQMYVAPRQNIAVATILAGPATLPGGVVIEMSKRIMWAALEDSGAVSGAGMAPPPLPPVAPIPEQLFQFAGIYAGIGHAMVKLTFNQAANGLDTARLVDGKFEPGESFLYRGDGRFYAADSRSFSFAHANDGGKLLRQHVDDKGGVATIAEGVGPDEGMDTSEFDDRTWVPQNLRATDFVTLMYSGLYRTGSIKALPGVIHLHAGNHGDATPYGLANRFRTKMILQYETDLVDLEIIHKDGRRVLRVGALEFADAESVPPLQQFERVVIGPDGHNVVRRVVSGTSFKSSGPADGRILIHAKDGNTTFDSLFAGNSPVAVSPGSFVVFIGNPDAVFVAQTM